MPHIEAEGLRFSVTFAALTKSTSDWLMCEQ